MPALTESEIAKALVDLPAWSLDGDALVAMYRRKDWRDAITFVNAVADEAERRDHHPDVCIAGDRTVTLRLTTHSEGGVTERDIRLASWIDRQSRD